VETPFYEEWWFLLVMALSLLIITLLVAFALVLRRQSRKYKDCSTGVWPARGSRPHGALAPRGQPVPSRSRRFCPSPGLGLGAGVGASPVH
jgi:hypothetical protein